MRHLGDEYVIGFQCSTDTPELCSDPAERKRYETLQKQRNERAAAAARAAEAARKKRDGEVKDLMHSMGMSPARDAELRRLAEMREAAGLAAPHGSTSGSVEPAVSPKPPKPECKRMPRRVTPLTASFPTRGAAEASARTKVANACGVQGVASIALNCHSTASKQVSMKNGKVLGTSTTPSWACAPVAACVDTVERCGGNNTPSAASQQ